MFEILDNIRDAASIGGMMAAPGAALITCGIVAYFFAPARRAMIAIGAIVLAGAGGLLYGDQHGASRKQSEWDAANARAAVAADKRDASNDTELSKDFPPISPAEQQQADGDAQRILADISAAAAGNCVLGPGPLRLRQK